MSARFVEVEVDACEGCDDGLSMRFKAAGDTVTLTALRYESERGTEGLWRVEGLDHEGQTMSATATPVDDSSAGLSWLVAGGRQGLRLAHPDGETERVPYLLLASIVTE